MRITQFSGLAPKIADKSLPQNRGVIAENMDIYGGHLRPIRLPRDTGQHLLTTCGALFTGTPVTVHHAGSVYVAWDKKVFTAVDWTEKLGPTTFLFVENGKLYRQSAERLLAGRCPIEVGIKRPEGETITTSVESQAGCEETKIPLLCVPDNDCDNVEHPPVPVAYLFTYVNGCGEESAHSKPSEVQDIKWGDAVLINVTADNVPENAVKRRWYRAVTDNEGVARWLKIAETPISQTQFYDMNCPCDFSCELMTENHDAPPDCLEGVAAIGDNMTIVWSNRHFWVSEENFPHAYNLVNEYKLRFHILGMYETTPRIEGEVHYTLLVITNGLHYTLSADKPSSVGISEIQQRYKCTNPDGVGIAEGEVIYPCEQGICSLSMQGETLLTGAIMTENEWAKFRPHEVKLAYYDDRIFGFHKDGGFIMQVGNDGRRDADFVTHKLKVDIVFNDEISPFLLFKGNKIYEWGKGDKAFYDWKSNTDMMAGIWRPVACKVISPDFVNTVPRGFREANASFTEWKRKFPNGDVEDFFKNNPEYQVHYASLLGHKPSVTVIIYADGNEYYRKVVSSNKPFLLPRKYKAIDWSIRVIGQLEIEEIHLQSSRETLLSGD